VPHGVETRAKHYRRLGWNLASPPLSAAVDLCALPWAKTFQGVASQVSLTRRIIMTAADVIVPMVAGLLLGMLLPSLVAWIAS